MREKRKNHGHKYWRIGGLITLLIVIACGVLGELSFGVPSVTHGRASQLLSSKQIEITVYLTTETLSEIFQNRVNEILGKAVATDPINNLPRQIRQMADALLQPAASFNDIVPRQDNLSTDLQLSLFPNDPHPINARMRISFQVLSSSMLQVSVKPLPGNPALMISGPIASIQIPLGQLSSVSTTPSCGETALALHLQFPLSLSSLSPTATSQPSTTTTVASSDRNQARPQTQSQPQPESSALNLSVGIPPSSLNAIGQSMGSIPIRGTMSASNVHITIQDGTLNITSDLYMGSLNIGSTRTIVSAAATNGSLAMHVLNTSVQLFHTLPFSYNMYNQQVETALNTRLQAIFANKLTISRVTLGNNTSIVCAPTNAVLLTGSTHLE